MYGIAVDDEGNVYVTDYSATSFAYSTTSIQKFDSNGVFLSKWGSYGSGNGQLYNPHGVATDSAGNVYVVDQGNHRIQKFDSSGEFLTKWGIYDVGEHDYQHSSPIGIALDSLGNVYVADHGSHYIHVFSDDGTPEPIEQPIPEPSTILLLTTGVVGMASYGFIRRRRL